MSWSKSTSRIGQETTIVTNSGNKVQGKIAYDKNYSPDFIDTVLGIATGGFSVLIWPDNKTTVIDSKGNYWTGKEKK